MGSEDRRVFRSKAHGDSRVGWLPERLPGWLSETSPDGSGDDITMGILCRSSTLDPS